jgi:hypothetical protein
MSDLRTSASATRARSRLSARASSTCSWPCSATAANSARTGPPRSPRRLDIFIESLCRLPYAGKPALKTSTTHHPTNPKAAQALFDLPALNSMRRTASSSRSCGRDAVGLRPSLDPGAYFDAPTQDKGARTTNQNNTAVALDRPLSFRNDLRCEHFHYIHQASAGWPRCRCASRRDRRQAARRPRYRGTHRPC